MHLAPKSYRLTAPSRGNFVSSSASYTILLLSKRPPLGGTGVGGAGFLWVCGVDLGLWNCNERPNLSPKDRFSPRPEAPGALAPGRSALKYHSLTVYLHTYNCNRDRLRRW